MTPANRPPEGSQPEEQTMEQTGPLNPWWMVEELIFPGAPPVEVPGSSRRQSDGLEPATRELPVLEEPDTPAGPARRS
jgi:hypothetical protein